MFLMSRYTAKSYTNRREYLDWLAGLYDVDRADVVLLASILGTDQDFDGLPTALADLTADSRRMPFSGQSPMRKLPLI